MLVYLMTKRKLIDIHYRLAELPDVELPFSVRSVGHYIAEQNWSETKSVYCDFIQLYWCVSGAGGFIMDGKEYLLEPGFVCFYRRGVQNEIRTLSREWNYRWFTFDGSGADMLLDGFAYPGQPFYAGSCPEDLFIRLTEEIYDSSPFGLRKIGATAYALLAQAGGTPRRGNKNDQLVARCIELVREIYDEPETGISLLADELGVHRSTLNRAFKEKMKMSPMKYLIGFRVQRALAMLRQTTLPIAEIGRKNGYPDPCYFSKLIKNAVGVSPESFRL